MIYFQVGYILSLGVASSYRKQGIASLLLDQLISHLNSNYCNQVKALYLHVLTTNTQAIHFYEHRLVSHAKIIYFKNILKLF